MRIGVLFFADTRPTPYSIYVGWMRNDARRHRGSPCRQAFRGFHPASTSDSESGIPSDASRSWLALSGIEAPGVMQQSP